MKLAIQAEIPSSVYPALHLSRTKLLLSFWLAFVSCFGLLNAKESTVAAQEDDPKVSATPTSTYELRATELASLPGDLGVAGPFVGTNEDALILAGGANFPLPVWENAKEWRDEIYVLSGKGSDAAWQFAGRLKRPLAYGASATTPHGLVCIGGCDQDQLFSEVTLLQWDSAKQVIVQKELPPLPKPFAYGQAVAIDSKVYFCGGQTTSELASASSLLLMLDLSKMDDGATLSWQALSEFPGPARAFYLLSKQHDGFEESIFLTSGRRQKTDSDRDPENSVEFLMDHWRYRPSLETWDRRADVPRCVMAGTAIGYGQSHLFVLGGADGRLFGQADQLKDEHPGFPKQAWCYHTITDRWSSAGELPINQVTTTAVLWQERIVIPSGEVRPRVRTLKVFVFDVESQAKKFGIVNYGVLICYLLLIVGVGLYFTRRNRNTTDYFRGGKKIPWWAAGCSIFATMLSSLTFTGIPSKAFAQDWVYAVGNFMIPVVAVFAVFVVLPFYRRLDAASAYEYLEKRFSQPVKWFASGSFALFHLFRMAVVMSLTGLALAVATPLSPSQAVLLMGVLSIVYCVLGGIEAVIWTDTIQTFVLLGGGLLALFFLFSGSQLNPFEAVEIASNEGKLNLANFHWDLSATRLAFGIVILGSIGQNVSSYSADQAVVQRYMTTSTQRQAANSIWVNGLLTLPATLLFFGIGTGLYLYYQVHPERLDPTASTDQVFPLFIARELPVGLAGLIVAGIFAAAQSTVSTSMNSTATTIVSDFMRPLFPGVSDGQELWLARFVTLLMGLFGTLLGLLFVDPEIKSLFEAFIKVIGLFMGVLGGLFLLGVFTRRANSTGALAGGILGAASVFCLWQFTEVNGYAYTICGIVVCVVVGYITSLCVGSRPKNLQGLTLFTQRDSSTTVES